MGSVYRDRTTEFRSLSETLKKAGGVTAAVSPAKNDPSASVPSGSPAATRSEFSRKASRIGLGIQETSQKIVRLAQCMHFVALIEAMILFYPFSLRLSFFQLCLVPGKCINWFEFGWFSWLNFHIVAIGML